jgi:hypothetical protein
MILILRTVGLSCLASVLGVAGTTSGWLVDSKCYASMLDNRNAAEVSWDGNLAIRYCTPDKKTKSFAVVRWDDGSNFNFNPAGNEKAAELPLSADKKFVYRVNVTGETRRNTVQVDAISIRARINREGPGSPGL